MDFINVLGCLAALLAAIFSGITVYKLLIGNSPTVYFDVIGEVSVFNNNKHPIFIIDAVTKEFTLQTRTGVGEDGFISEYLDIPEKEYRINSRIDGMSERTFQLKVRESDDGKVKPTSKRCGLFENERFNIVFTCRK